MMARRRHVVPEARQGGSPPSATVRWLARLPRRRQSPNSRRELAAQRGWVSGCVGAWVRGSSTRRLGRVGMARRWRGAGHGDDDGDGACKCLRTLAARAHDDDGAQATLCEMRQTACAGFRSMFHGRRARRGRCAAGLAGMRRPIRRRRPLVRLTQLSNCLPRPREPRGAQPPRLRADRQA